MLLSAATATGLKVVGTYVIKKGLVTKAAALAYKIWQAHKIGTALTAITMIGATKYTVDCIRNLRHGVTNVMNGEYSNAIINFGKASLYNADIDTIPEFIQTGLDKLHLSTEKTVKVVSWLKYHDNEIINYVKNH